MSSAAIATFRELYLQDLAIGTAEGQTDTVNVLGVGPTALTKITLASLAASLVNAPTGDAAAGAAGVRTGVLYVGPGGGLCVKGPDAAVVATANGSQTSFSYTFTNGCYACLGFVGGALQAPSTMAVVSGVATMTLGTPPASGTQIIFVRTA